MGRIRRSTWAGKADQERAVTRHRMGRLTCGAVKVTGPWAGWEMQASAVRRLDGLSPGSSGRRSALNLRFPFRAGAVVSRVQVSPETRSTDEALSSMLGQGVTSTAKSRNCPDEPASRTRNRKVRGESTAGGMNRTEWADSSRNRPGSGSRHSHWNRW